MSFDSHSRRKSRSNENGYALLTLLLVLAMLAIFAAAAIPTIKFSMQRDREEEMIHRGAQYARAIRGYYKKFGRYPVKLEDLESTNNLRFLRKRYKDPITGKDFKLLHFGEVQMLMSGFGGGSIPGATPVSAMGGSSASPGGQSSAFGQSSSFGQSSFGQSSAFGQSSSTTSSFGQSSSFGGNSSFGGTSSFGNNSSGTQPNQTAGQPGADATDTSTPAAAAPGTQDADASGQPGQIIGGPIVGVASTSKDTTIREFNHKKKYKDWVFVYDPMQDQGRLIMTPYQPQLQTFAQPNLNGQPAGNGTNSNGTNGNGFGSGFNSGTFGSSPGGMQNSPSSSPGGFGNSNPNPPNNSPQQQ
jgi:type II secretory pathway pseudopilin PulG